MLLLFSLLDQPPWTAVLVSCVYQAKILNSPLATHAISPVRDQNIKKLSSEL